MIIQRQCQHHLSSLARGLVGWWPFFRGPVDESGNPKQNGVVQVSTVILSRGLRGPSYIFPGSGSNAIVCGPSYPSPTALSVCCWVRPAVTTRGDMMTVWTSSGQFNLLYGLTSGKPQFFTAGSNSGVGANAMAVNTWNHLVGTTDGTNINIYLNGALEATVATGTGIASGSGVNIILGNNTSANGALNGHLADCRVYNRMLSAAEVFALSREAFLPKIDIEKIALMRVASGGGAAATPWLYVNNNIPVLGTGAY